MVLPCLRLNGLQSSQQGPRELESAQIKETEKDLAPLPSSTPPYLPGENPGDNLKWPDTHQILNSLSNSQVASIP